MDETVNPLPQKHRREMRTSLNPLVHGTDTERFDRVDAKFVQVGKIHRDLGIELQEDTTGSRRTILVSKVQAGKTAEISGKVLEGDRVHRVNGQDVVDMTLDAIRESLNNSAVTLILFRHKSAGRGIRARGRLSVYMAEKDSQRLKLLFDLLDADGSGFLDLKELTCMCVLLRVPGEKSQALLKKHLAKAKKQNDALDWEEFQLLQPELELDQQLNKSGAIRGACERVQSVKAAFNKCDVDGNGDLSGSEILIVMRRLGVNVTKDDCDQLVAQIDELGDGNGTVDWSEFLHALTDKDFKANLSPVFSRFTIDNLAQLPSLLDADKIITKEEQKRIMAGMGQAEKLGVNYLQNRQKKKQVAVEASVESDYGRSFWLHDGERAYLRRCTLTAVLWAAFAGILSAVFAYAAELAFEKLDWAKEDVIIPAVLQLPVEDGMFQWGHVVVFATVIFASIVEILIVYRITFRTALDITQVTKLVLSPPDEHRVWVASSLVRTALEMGNPTTVVWGINPMRNMNKYIVLFAVFMYKAKRGLSSFIIKLLVKRVLVRTASKSFLAMVAAPINAFWNALTMYKVLSEAKIVALGPAAACEVLNEMFLEHDVMSPKLCVQLMRSVALVITTKGNVHPNLHIMEEFIVDLVSDKLPPHPKFVSLDELRDNFKAAWDTQKGHKREVVEERKKGQGCLGKMCDAVMWFLCCCGCCDESESQEKSAQRKILDSREEEFWEHYQTDNKEQFLADMGSMSTMDKQLTLATLCLGIVMAGKTNRRYCCCEEKEKTLYREVVDACGLPNRWPEVVRLSARFVRGDNWDIEDLVKIVDKDENKDRESLSHQEHARAWAMCIARCCAI